MKEVRIDSGKNYWCSWATQWALGKTKGLNEGKNWTYFEGDGSKFARGMLNETQIFGEDGFAYQYPEIRGELFLLLDDGWDVPIDVNTERGIRDFGSVIPNEDRFPSFPGTPAERLKGINDRLVELGWQGLGLWISPQMSGDDFDKDFDQYRDQHRAYWKERVLWCKQAGVRYWKVDWGTFGIRSDYRKMMTDLGKAYFPELIIEHSMGSSPYNGIPWKGKIRYTDQTDLIERAAKVCDFCEVYRSYDITEDMLGDTTTLDRLAYFLSFASCVINCEDAMYIGAALGCALGVMRSHYGQNWLNMHSKLDEVTAAVKWQRYAPSFAGGELKVSQDVLVDHAFFGPTDTWNRDIINQDVGQAAPTVMARNTELPTVVRTERMPFVIASKNPTGVYSLAAIKRREYWVNTKPATVCCAVGHAERIGVFGEFEEIRLQFDLPPQKLFAQNLIRGEEQELELERYLTDRTLTMPKVVLDAFHTVSDLSDPAMMLRVEF